MVIGDFSFSIRIKPKEGEEWRLSGVYGPRKRRKKTYFERS